LQLAAAGVGGFAEQENTFGGVFGERLQAVAPHVGVDRHRVGAIDAKGFPGIKRRRTPNVVALRVEDEELFGIDLADVLTGGAQANEPVLARVMGKLRFVSDRVGRGGVDERTVEAEKRFRLVAQVNGQPREIRVEPHAESGPQRRHFVSKGHIIFQEGEPSGSGQLKLAGNRLATPVHERKSFPLHAVRERKKAPLHF